MRTQKKGCDLINGYLGAFLFKQAKDMGLEVEETEEGNKENLRQKKLKMLTSWLPLLCRARNGTDAPELSISERAELEKLLEETIEMLEKEEQEQVLSLWLHHFTHSPSSDWPNLHESYACWHFSQALAPPLIILTRIYLVY
ncbi:hypothetical protein QQP08_007509 [Theobroma cacao]|nr:hypothetical protein QQP08_007509 [Theobroma cacao]